MENHSRGQSDRSQRTHSTASMLLHDPPNLGPPKSHASSFSPHFVFAAGSFLSIARASRQSTRETPSTTSGTATKPRTTTLLQTCGSCSLRLKTMEKRFRPTSRHPPAPPPRQPNACLLSSGISAVPQKGRQGQLPRSTQ